MSDWIREHLPFLGDDEDDAETTSSDAETTSSGDTSSGGFAAFFDKVKDTIGIGDEDAPSGAAEAEEDSGGWLGDVVEDAREVGARVADWWDENNERLAHEAKVAQRKEEYLQRDTDRDGFTDPDEKYAGTDVYRPTSRQEFEAGQRRRQAQDEQARIEAERAKHLREDSDEDGWTDLQEDAMGSDPFDDTDVPRGPFAQTLRQVTEDAREDTANDGQIGPAGTGFGALGAFGGKPPKHQILQDSDADGSYDHQAYADGPTEYLDDDGDGVVDAWRVELSQGRLRATEDEGRYLLRSDTDGDGSYDRETDITERIQLDVEEGEAYVDEVYLERPAHQIEAEQQAVESAPSSEPEADDETPASTAMIPPGGTETPSPALDGLSPDDPSSELAQVADRADSMLDDLDPYAGDDPNDDLDGDFA